MLMLNFCCFCISLANSDLTSEILFSELRKENRKQRGEPTSIMEMTSSESLVIHKSEKGKKNFGNLIDDTMVCSLIKHFILIRFSIS